MACGIAAIEAERRAAGCGRRRLAHEAAQARWIPSRVVFSAGSSAKRATEAVAVEQMIFRVRAANAGGGVGRYACGPRSREGVAV